MKHRQSKYCKKHPRSKLCRSGRRGHNRGRRHSKRDIEKVFKKNWRKILQKLKKPMQKELDKRHIHYKDNLIDITKKFAKQVLKRKNFENYEIDNIPDDLLEREGIAPIIIAALISLIPAILSFFKKQKDTGVADADVSKALEDVDSTIGKELNNLDNQLTGTDVGGDITSPNYATSKDENIGNSFTEGMSWGMVLAFGGLIYFLTKKK